MENCTDRMVMCMKVNGLTTKFKVEVSRYKKMVILMRVNGMQMTVMVRVCIFGMMETDMLVIGATTLGAGMVSFNGLMGMFILENGRMIKDMDMEKRFIKMAVFSKVNGLMIIEKVLGYICGLMATSMKEYGAIILTWD
jgi:hypothetical protein